MTRDDTVKLIKIMTDTYPNYHPENISDTANTWAVVLREYDFGEIKKGLMSFMLTDKSGFAPSIGQIVNLAKRADDENGLEAWGKVRDAVRNSYYYSEREFATLPDDVKRAVGTPGQLRAWSIIDSNAFETVAQSQFLKMYAAEVKKTAENKKLPHALKMERKEIEALPEIEEPDEAPEPGEITNDIKNKLDSLKEELGRRK